jgi:hypothetical protein
MYRALADASCHLLTPDFRTPFALLSCSCWRKYIQVTVYLPGVRRRGNRPMHALYRSVESSQDPECRWWKRELDGNTLMDFTAGLFTLVRCLWISASFRRLWKKLDWAEEASCTHSPRMQGAPTEHNAHHHIHCPQFRDLVPWHLSSVLHPHFLQKPPPCSKSPCTLPHLQMLLQEPNWIHSLKLVKLEEGSHWNTIASVGVRGHN